MVEYLNDIKNFNLLSAEEEIELAKKIENGDLQAKNKLINSNLRLVISIAKKFKAPNLSLSDLIQEGNIGLMTAASKFNYRNNCRFSTYASYWIIQSIKRAISDTSRTIRLPNHINESLRILKKHEDLLEQQLHRDPTVEEVANSLNLDANKVLNLYNYSKAAISLETPIGDDETTVSDFVEDTKNENPEEVAILKNKREQINKGMSCLTPREKAVIIYRFGLNNHPAMTLTEVGDIFDITRERVRQIESHALLKMKHSKNIQDLQALV